MKTRPEKVHERRLVLLQAVWKGEDAKSRRSRHLPASFTKESRRGGGRGGAVKNVIAQSHDI